MNADISPSKSLITVRAAAEQMEPYALQLADRLQLPISGLAPESAYVLEVSSAHLALQCNDRQAPGPLFVDFSAPALSYRRRFGGGKKQSLARALGIRKKARPVIIDATAGLGRDGFILAGLGCEVHMIERSPIVFELLADGVRRGSCDPAIGRIIKENMTIYCGDSISLLLELVSSRQPTAVYLDPMFPLRNTSALVKKEMRLLREIVGDDQDAGKLLAAALQSKVPRVVVKRFSFTPPIPGYVPGAVVKEGKSRFDVYFP